MGKVIGANCAEPTDHGFFHFRLHHHGRIAALTETDAVLAVDRIVIAFLDQGAAFDPGQDDSAALCFFLVGAVFLNDPPRGAFFGGVDGGIALTVGQAGVDVVEDKVKYNMVGAGPCVWRDPWLDGLDVIAGW